MSNYRDSIEIYECVLCGTKKQSRLDVDHKDGNNSNHNPNNLQVLCKFCHRFKTELDRKNQGIKFFALTRQSRINLLLKKKFRSASTEWYKLYGNKYKGDTKFSTNYEDILDDEDVIKVNEIYRKLLLNYVERNLYLNFNLNDVYVYSPGTSNIINTSAQKSSNLEILYDLVQKETYNTAWLDNIFKDEIIDDKLIFTFSQKNSKDYFLKYYWNHSYWQKKFRPFLRKLVKTVYGKDYRIFLKVEEYIAPTNKYIQEPEGISERISKKSWSKMSNNERYPLMHDFSNPLKSRIGKEFPWSKNPLGEHDWEDVKRDLDDK